MTNPLFNKQIAANDLTELLRDALFDINNAPPQETIVWRIEGQNIGSLGNFALLTGLPKAGKGKYICGITAAGLTRDEIFGQWVKLPPEKNKISYWDTEQSKFDHFQMLKTIQNLIQQETLPDQFKSYHVRKHDAQTIIPMIEHELSVSPNIGMIVLDGLLDLIDSFNDEKQSKALVNFLKRITDIYNILVLGVLHRSKSVDRSMGHLGSAADRAAQSVLKVEKDKEKKHYILSAEYLRNADDFTPIAIYYNKNLHTWEQTDYLPPDQTPKQNKERQLKPDELDISVHTLNVLRIFNQANPQSYETLIQNIRETYFKGRNWSVECLKFLTQKEQLIFKNIDGYTNTRQAKLFIQK